MDLERQEQCGGLQFNQSIITDRCMATSSEYMHTHQQVYSTKK